MQTFNIVSALSVVAGLFSALYILFDLRRHPQPMPIMRSVWVLTGLWAGPLGLWLYRRMGRARPAISGRMRHRMEMPERKPRRQSVVRSTLHCGAGCTLADLIGEGFLYFFPVAVGGSFVLGGWVVDYLLALALGIYFQYAAIRSMRKISGPKAFEQALKADFLSLTAWQVGMYGWMALTIALWPELMSERMTWRFWFCMQIGMLCGFVCSYPVNVLLIRNGIKNTME